MVTQVIPTLSLAGFVQDMPTKIDRMLAYYLTSDYSQSNVFKGRILSLQKHVQAYQHDLRTLTTKVREDLEGYFGAVCDAQTISVSAETPNPDDPNRINLSISAMLYKDGKGYSLGKLIETQNSITLSIINLNNEGVVSS